MSAGSGLAGPASAGSRMARLASPGPGLARQGSGGSGWAEPEQADLELAEQGLAARGELGRTGMVTCA